MSSAANNAWTLTQSIDYEISLQQTWEFRQENAKSECMISKEIEGASRFFEFPDLIPSHPPIGITLCATGRNSPR